MSCDKKETNSQVVPVVPVGPGPVVPLIPNVGKKGITIKLRYVDGVRPKPDTETHNPSPDHTPPENDPLYQLLGKIPKEVKTCSEQAAQDVWNPERLRLIRTMAGLVGTTVEELEQRLVSLPNRKGRPKRRKNPWHDLFHY